MGVMTTCKHCGMAYSTARAAAVHETACLHDPENEAKLRTVPTDIPIGRYDATASANGWPSRTFIAKQFGSWLKFKAWLASDLPFSAIRPAVKPTHDSGSISAELAAEISQQVNENRLAARVEVVGLQAFDTPRRTWQAGGRTWVSWGLR